MNRQCGFTLVEIMIVCAIIALLAAIAIPNYATARIRTQRTVCINNLRQIDSAKQEWALEMGKTAANPAPVAADIQGYIGRGSAGSLAKVVCPTDNGGTIDSSYVIGEISTLPTCKVLGDNPAARLHQGAHLGVVFGGRGSHLSKPLPLSVVKLGF